MELFGENIVYVYNLMHNVMIRTEIKHTSAPTDERPNILMDSVVRR